MKSNKTAPPTAPKRAPYKFLTRNLTIACENYSGGHFQKACIKRPYVQKLICPMAHEYNKFSMNPFTRFKAKKKLWATLKHIEIPYLCQDDLYDVLKFSQVMRSFSIDSYIRPEGEDPYDTSLRTVAFYLRKLPVQVKSIKLHIHNKDLSADKTHFYKIATSTRFLPNLQCFDRYYDLPGENQNYLSKELQIYSNAISRLANLKRFVYNLSPFEQAQFQKVMKADVVFSGITDLKLDMSVEGFPSNRMPDPQVYRDSRDHDDSIENSQDSMEEELKPFYRFDLFPNLKKLKILYGNGDDDGYYHTAFLYPLGSFVVDGFAALKNLEQLEISVKERQKNTAYFFKALGKLPMLKRFSLIIEFIRHEEWILLQQFLRDQKNLESVCIDIQSSSNFEDDEYGEPLIQSLRGKPHLKSIELKSNSWSLEGMSKGFAHLEEIKNQLHTLKIQARDESIEHGDLEAESKKRVKGLCLFLENQRDSLKMLEVNISEIIEDKPVNQIGKAISKLLHLRELHLSLYLYERGGEERRDYGDPYFTLNKTLLKLENLESFKLAFTTIDECFEVRPTEKKDIWFLHVMEALPMLESLQRVCVVAENTVLARSLQFKIRNAVRRLVNIKSIKAKLDFYSDEWNGGDVLKPAIDEINEKQSIRCDLMF